MSQILTNIEGSLKDKYQPALSNLINIEPSPFLEMIRKEPLQNNKVRMAAPIGLNGGFGFGAEGASTPASAEQRYLDFELNAVDMYVDMQISNKTVVLGSSNTGSMINALDAEIKGSYAAAKWNLGRALFGDGSGILCHFNPMDDAAEELTVDDTGKLMEGILVDVYIGAGTSYSRQLSGVRVLSVDHKNKKVKFNMDEIYIEEPGMLTVQNSYNREITGLGAIFGNGESLYGVSRVENPCLIPQSYSLGGKITDIGLYRGIRDAKKYRGAKINLIMMGDRAFEAYQTYMDDHTTHLVDKHKFVGGSTGYSILVGDQEVILVNESMIPENEAWGVDTDSFILQQTPWEFLSNQGSIFSLMANSSIYRALLASYGNLICSNPGGCVKFTDCAA
ncbi:MAG: phage major capsid protein [Clostridia bacterium]|nr:phage major capsid protein [Clostridia bacterium]